MIHLVEIPIRRYRPGLIEVCVWAKDTFDPSSVFTPHPPEIKGDKWFACFINHNTSVKSPTGVTLAAKFQDINDAMLFELRWG